MLILCSVVLIWDIFHFPVEIGVPKHIMQKEVRVPEPNIIGRIHPWWYVVQWFGTIVGHGECLPWNITKWCRINSVVQVMMTCEWWSVVMLNQ